MGSVSRSCKPSFGAPARQQTKLGGSPKELSKLNRAELWENVSGVPLFFFSLFFLFLFERFRGFKDGQTANAGEMVVLGKNRRFGRFGCWRRWRRDRRERREADGRDPKVLI